MILSAYKLLIGFIGNEIHLGCKMLICSADKKIPKETHG